MNIVPLALAFLDEKMRDQLTGAKTTAKSLAIVGVFAAVSAAFFVIALTIVLASRVGIVGACLIMGAIFGLLAVAIYFRYSRKKQVKQAVQAERAAIASSANATGGAGLALLLEAFLRGFMKK